MIKDLKKGKVLDEVKEGIWIVDFSATWCGPCKMLEPVLDDIGKDYNVLKVDVDAFNDEAIKYGIMSVPNIVIFKDGEILNQVIGYHTKDELLDMIKDE